MHAQVLAAARKLEEQSEWQYSMEASFIEIYNNQLRDLLHGGPSSGAYINDLHAIKHDPDGGHTIVSGRQGEPGSVFLSVASCRLSPGMERGLHMRYTRYSWYSGGACRCMQRM